jgi:histidyl-tRNA synthetase
MELAPPRGTQDFLPPAGDHLRALYDRAATLAHRYGFRYVETPVFEATDLFDHTSGSTSDIVAKEMYTFADRKGRSLTLRPEGTAPVVRAYLAHRGALGAPFKAYYLARMYRYARPQAGRYREHRQFGVEVVGVEGPRADVEVIQIGDAYLREVGLSRYRLELNSIGDAVCRPGYRELLVSYLEGRRDELRDEHRDRFAENPLRVLDCKDEACRAVAAEAPRITDHLCDDCRAHLDAVLDGVREVGLEPILTPTLVRGMDYYTRTAFEFVSEVLSDQQGTLFGGGRYDGLAEALGGPATPGVGFGMGLERVLLALEDEGLAPPAVEALRCFVVTVDTDAADAALALLRGLRASGVSADASLEDRPLKAQLKMADRAGADYAAIIGARELAGGTVTLRRLADGEQRSVTVDALAATLTGEGA